MRATNLFKVLEDTAVQLIHVSKTGHLHVRSGLFTTNATRAEHDNWLVLQFLRQTRDAFRKFTKVIETHFDGVVESAKVIFVIIAGIQQMNFAAFVQPTLQFFRRKLWGGPLRRSNTVDAERNDLFLDLHQHAIERLVLILAFLRLQIGERRIGTQEIDKQMDGIRRPGDKQINPFVAEQHSPLQIQFHRATAKCGATIFKVVQRDELITGNVNNRRSGVHRRCFSCRGWHSGFLNRKFGSRPAKHKETPEIAVEQYSVQSL